MRETVIVEAVRTPVGKRNGGLSGMHAADLSAIVLNEVLERSGVGPEIVDDVIWGCVSQVGDQSSNIGRYAVLAAGWPESIPGTTVNRACGSSQQALDFAVHAVMSGQHMLEQTFHLPVDRQYNREASPLAILTRLRGRALI